jgi:hypothetical protein
VSGAVPDTFLAKPMEAFPMFLSSLRTGHAKRRPRMTAGRRAAPRPLLEALEDRLLLAVRTWTGASSFINNAWSNPLNWLELASPYQGDDVVFPAVASTKQSVNDLDATFALASMRFGGDGYSLSGMLIKVDSLTQDAHLPASSP